MTADRDSRTLVLGFPRIGGRRELKSALESYWRGGIPENELVRAAEGIRRSNLLRQKRAGIGWIPCGDFSLYDQMLDMVFLTGAVPTRFGISKESRRGLETYFLLARGKNRTTEAPALEMTKWFDTNYHYLVPEWTRDTVFSFDDPRLSGELREAKGLGIRAIPKLIGPLTFLFLGKEKESGFSRLELLPRLLKAYSEILEDLAHAGAEWAQIEEPILSCDLPKEWREAFQTAYEALSRSRARILLANYFGPVGDFLPGVLALPVHGFHFDLVRGAEDLPALSESFPEGKVLSAGVVDGRNIWRNDYRHSLDILKKLERRAGPERLLVSTSCSLQFVPLSLEPEVRLDPEIKSWLAFAEEKLRELSELAALLGEAHPREHPSFRDNQAVLAARGRSEKTRDEGVRERLKQASERGSQRRSPFPVRRKAQRGVLDLPMYPTTTIGSFPQTPDIRRARERLRKGEWTKGEYEAFLKKEIGKLIRLQEKIGLDVLVHGEFERNDMVQYFGEALSGFVFTQDAWVQSYGSRCVKPPILYGDVSRPGPMTVGWTAYAQSLTARPVKGMLTGPITMLQWSFAREDLPRRDAAWQIALAIRDEVLDLEKAGIRVIQIDEPALREGLPLRERERPDYLDWSAKAFRLAAGGVRDETQIHTHMCYSEFNDIIRAIAALDADVISIENSRSGAELLKVFRDFRYGNEIGPGVWDIHSPRIPSADEIAGQLRAAARVLPPENLWVNPDCGLKTRGWPETTASLENMVAAAKEMRAASG
ncbi:MAG TPA: 5-methyltetrahydropteroyltriglutamate--homocysteine S-methyltransferase [Elusimicrobia bacterium]|nr:5-methyltetrahydropteroyltriglutamate--homocysteine S-methyltransferase [Elusimicrobiota bacterium]